MLGESMTARRSSSWWTSIYLLPLAPAAHISGLAPESAILFCTSERGAPYSTLRTSACGKFHSQVRSELLGDLKRRNANRRCQSDCLQPGEEFRNAEGHDGRRDPRPWGRHVKRPRTRGGQLSVRPRH